MAGILGYLSILADDIGSIASKTVATTSKSLLTSLDDIGILFDDVMTYTKLAGAKSSGIIVDDLAAISSFTNETTSDILKNELKKANSLEELKANIENLDKKSQEQVKNELEEIKQNAIKEIQKKVAKRELPIVYKIAKGSFKNKFVIIPLVLLLSYLAPFLISPLLIIGGIYLAYEGAEVIIEKFFHKDENEEKKEDISTLSNEEFEKEKVKSAIKTDFILSFEIIVITLSLLEQSSFVLKFLVLCLVGILTTIGVYGIVALIIKLDDIGFYFEEKKAAICKAFGNALIKSMPVLIKIISIVGTIAMLAVGGGIIDHETHALEFLNSFLSNSFIQFLAHILLGLIIGLFAVLIHSLIKKFKK